MLREVSLTAIADRPQFSGTAEAAFMEAADLPVGWIAGFQVQPGRYMFAYRPDRLDHQGAVAVAHAMVGPFVDVTAEVTAEVSPC